MTLRYWTDTVGLVLEYYDDDNDDEPTLVDTDGVEYGYCIKGQTSVPLLDLTWDGVCRKCEVCDED